jgi:hypothetical protein
MRARGMSLQIAPEDLNPSEARVPVSEWPLNMKLKVNANTQRIFNALIEPEYRELWLRLPNQQKSDRTVASQSKSLSRADYFRSDSLELTILGSYRCRTAAEGLLGLWNASSNAVARFVEIRLDGCFDSGMRSLTHCGIRGEKEYRWQKEMWRASLKRLQRLFWVRNQGGLESYFGNNCAFPA